MSKEILLECRRICKNFGPTRALINVDFTLRRGEVCGLIGENGSGKSTLTSIIAGLQRPVSGEMRVKGELYSPQNMQEAQHRGISMVVQENAALSGVNVASNVFVGNANRFSKFGFLQVQKMLLEADAILKRIGAPEISASALTDSLNFEDRKIVEIARAMYLQPDILIIDETTTALAQKGRRIIYDLIAQMQAEDKAVIFISHDLDELVQVCNTIFVLRDGNVIGRLNKEEISSQKMRELMVGRKMAGHYMRTEYDYSCGEEVMLDANNISSQDGYIRNLSFQVHKGEILGLGGLANSGMHEVGRMLFGIDEYITGKVTYCCREEPIKSAAQAIELNVGYISKDRDKESIILREKISENIVLPSLSRLKNSVLLLSPKLMRGLVEKMVASMSIKCVSPRQRCSELSGGNKQKVAFSKWIGSNCDVIIMDCPTRGIDIGVKADMYDLIYSLKKQGKAIIMISEELVELIGMSDRMLIFKDGAISKEFLRSPELTDSQIINYMI